MKIREKKGRERAEIQRDRGIPPPSRATIPRQMAEVGLNDLPKSEASLCPENSSRDETCDSPKIIAQLLRGRVASDHLVRFHSPARKVTSLVITDRVSSRQARFGGRVFSSSFSR